MCGASTFSRSRAEPRGELRHCFRGRRPPTSPPDQSATTELRIGTTLSAIIAKAKSFVSNTCRLEVPCYVCHPRLRLLPSLQSMTPLAKHWKETPSTLSASFIAVSRLRALYVLRFNDQICARSTVARYSSRCLTRSSTCPSKSSQPFWGRWVGNASSLFLVKVLVGSMGLLLTFEPAQARVHSLVPRFTQEYSPTLCQALFASLKTYAFFQHCLCLAGVWSCGLSPTQLIAKGRYNFPECM